MKYQFPVINNISQVLPLIKDKPEFIVAEREGGITIVNYVVMTSDTFPPIETEGDAILRELRGIIFETATGNILHRRYHKFFNALERAETQLSEIDFSEPHVILEKLDGSMITPVLTTNGIRWGTKMGVTDVAKPVEAFVAKNPIYEAFALWAQSEGQTVIFEWCSRQQRIVIDYPEDMLVLTAIRDNVTGAYMSYSDMVAEVEGFDIPVVKAFSGTAENMQSLIDYTRNLIGEEGFVVRFNSGHAIKVKAADYLRKHKTKDAMSREKNVIELIVTEKADDVKSFMDPDDLIRFNKFEADFWNGVKATVKHLEQIFSLRDPNASKKDFAVDFVQKLDPSLHRYMYSMAAGKAAFELVKDAITSACSTQTKIEEARSLFNCKWNEVPEQE